MINKIITAAILLVFTFDSCFELTPESRIDAILSQKYPSDNPGAVFLVAKMVSRFIKMHLEKQT